MLVKPPASVSWEIPAREAQEESAGRFRGRLPPGGDQTAGNHGRAGRRRFLPSDVGQKPVDIVNAALKEAKLKFYDVLLVDTAGRLHVDEAMMDEIKHVHAAINPVETLFVVDAMTGQDAANTAKAFNEALPLTGVVLTKVDGDARGGGAVDSPYYRQAD